MVTTICMYVFKLNEIKNAFIINARLGIESPFSHLTSR